MARRARIVLPGHPHHVTQRGNRRQQTFFCEADYALYRDFAAQALESQGVRCWAWCLMPNHVHLVLEPSCEGGLAAALKQAHQRYTRHINAREGWTGFLWQGRFASCAMDEGHALAAIRYVELNPVKAGLTRRAQDWPWSSARFHRGGPADGLTGHAPFLDGIRDWDAYLGAGLSPAEEACLGQFTQTGLPLGAPDWITAMEARTGARLTPQKPGRPKGGSKTVSVRD